MSPVMFQIAVVHDPAVRPDNRAIFASIAVYELSPLTRLRPFVLNLHERLLLLRMISHDA